MVEAPSNEIQQLVMVEIPFHQIIAEQEVKKEPQVPSTSQFLTPQVVVPTMEVECTIE